MPFRNIRPIHIMWQETLEVEMLDGVFSGIERVLSLAGVFNKFKLKYLGERRQPNWRDQNGLLNPYQSLDWHIEWARLKSKKAGHLNSAEFIDSLRDNPIYKTGTRYELAVVKEPLHWIGTFLRTVSAVGRRRQGAIISLASNLRLLQPVIGEKDEDREKRKFDFWLATQMITMHELGHVFGLFPLTGNKDLTGTDQELMGAHCLNECVMYWQTSAALNEKIKDQPFCPPCLEKLKQFFIAP